MRGGIFRKYILITSAVILLSIISLGAVLLLISSQFFSKNLQESLINNYMEIKASTIEALNENGKNPKSVNEVFSDFSTDRGLTIFLTNENGEIIVSSNEILDKNKRAISPALLSIQTRTPTYHYNKMGNYFDKDRHNVSGEIEMKHESYYLFISSSSFDHGLYMNKIFGVFITVSLVVIIVMFTILYTVARNIFKPLSKISMVAKSYAKGDFSKKIIVRDKSEVSEIANALNEMSASLGNLEIMRKSFIANVSHELRTPMTSISGFVDGILDGTIPKEKERVYLSVVSQETKRLSRLVASMLNIAKIESGETTLIKKNCNIIDLTVNCLVTLEKQISEKNIDISGLDNGENLVYADVDLLYQVVYNLIDNAIKFTNQNGQITFSTYTKENTFYYSIKNTGEGIKECELSLVFDRFYKSDQSRSKDKTGVGLGLYIASSIVNMHEGKIMVRSIEGEYTEFIFSIPKKDIKGD